MSQYGGSAAALVAVLSVKLSSQFQDKMLCYYSAIHVL